MQKFLYLPIEIGSRELNAKLLTAAAAAERGFTTLLGFQYHLFMNNAKLPPGIFFSKGSNRLYLQFVPAIRKSGHAFVASEEENFGYCLKDAPVSFNPAELKQNCDLYLCMGACEERFIEERFGLDFAKATTGNARVDALRPRLRALFDREVSEIKQRYGKFVLLNMNFGLTNPNRQTSYQQSFDVWVRGGIFRSPNPHEWKQQFDEFVQWELDNSAEMRRLIEALNAREFTVVIRPHPSESAETWRAFVGKLGSSRIHVLEGSPLVPFMRASEVMVHPGCTTGMEATIMGVSTICINAGATAVPTYYVSPKVNSGAATAAEALSLLEEHWQGSDVLVRDHAAQLAMLEDYLVDLSDDVLTADRISETLDRFSVQRAFPSSGRTLESVQWQTFSDGSNNFAANHQYRLSKFGIDDAEVSGTLARLRSALGRFKDVEAKRVYEGVYLIAEQ